MGLYLPPQLDWVGYIAGNPWPNEDEDDYWGIADDWSAARERLLALLPGGSSQPNLGTATQATQQAYSAGAGGDAIRTELHRLATGDGSLEDLAGQMSLVVDAANSTGSKIRELKLMILASLVLLAWELAMADLYPPTAPMADAEEIGSTRIYLQWLLREARLDIERVCEPLLDVVRAGGRLVTRLVEPVTDAVEHLGGAMYDAIEDAAGETVAKAVSYFPQLAWEKAPSTMKFVAAQDIIAQANPVLEHRSGFNYDEVGASLASAVAGTTFAAIPVGNFAGAAADELLGHLGADTSQGLAGGVRGMVAGAVGNESSTVVSNVVYDLVTTGKVSPGDWSVQGLVGGFSRSTLTGFTRGSVGELGAAPDGVGTPRRARRQHSSQRGRRPGDHRRRHVRARHGDHHDNRCPGQARHPHPRAGRLGHHTHRRRRRTNQPRRLHHQHDEGRGDPHDCARRIGHAHGHRRHPRHRAPRRNNRDDQQRRG